MLFLETLLCSVFPLAVVSRFTVRLSCVACDVDVVFPFHLTHLSFSRHEISEVSVVQSHWTLRDLTVEVNPSLTESVFFSPHEYCAVFLFTTFFDRTKDLSENLHFFSLYLLFVYYKNNQFDVSIHLKMAVILHS